LSPPEPLDLEKQILALELDVLKGAKAYLGSTSTSEILLGTKRIQTSYMVEYSREKVYMGLDWP
jgi:hypothetical protein